MARSNNNNKLKAFVRFDGSGRIVPSSLIVQAFKPKVGNYQEIDAKECCNYVAPTTTSTTTVTPTTTSTTTVAPTTTTTTTVIYSFEVMQCCSGTLTTAYSTSPSIIVGAFLYTNSGLTVPFVNEQGEGAPNRIGFDNFCDTSFNDAFFTNTSGEVTAINQAEGCE
jgi:hypothetical protein